MENAKEENEDMLIRYANSTEINITVSDVQMKFEMKDNDGKVIEKTSIFMSPQQLKMISLLTAQAVNNYENEVGEICLKKKVE